MTADPNEANGAIHFGNGVKLLEQGNLDDAIEQFSRADELWRMDESKNRKFALCGWADALHKLKRYDEAAEKYQEALGIDPDNPIASNGLGDVLADQERFDDAIAEYRKADQLWRNVQSQERKRALCGWGRALRLQKHYDEAAEKYREAVGVDPDYPWAYKDLGIVLAKQGYFEKATAQFCKADKLWMNNASKDRKYALWAWGLALRDQERFEEAIDKYRLATEVVPQEARAFLLFGACLVWARRYRRAITQFEKAAKLDPNNPILPHVKGVCLFDLGRYEEGWNEWRAARLCYERALKGEPWSAEQLEKAVLFADLLRDDFKCYEASEQYYRRVLQQGGDNAAACAGLAILYQRWANSDKVMPEIPAQLSYLVRRASELLKSQLGKDDDFQTFLRLADLYIETSDWTEVREQLAHADSLCGGSRLKHAEVIERLGLVCFRSEEHAEAVKNFRQALLVKSGDLTLQNNLGNALFRAKQFEAAQDEFARVLKLAPGNIESLLGAAEVSIELADDGDSDQYRIAEQHLTAALSYGRNKEWGSKRLQNCEIAKIYYMRGYARTKSYEVDASRILLPALRSALSDFKNCKNLDPNDRKAPVAIEKINKRLRLRRGELLVDVFGPLVIVMAAVFVFLFAQLDFFFPKTAVHIWLGLHSQKPVTEATYIALTFGSLLFMVAGLSLPKVLKLKVPGIELEKASVEQVSAPSTLGISRFESPKS